MHHVRRRTSSVRYNVITTAIEPLERRRLLAAILPGEAVNAGRYPTDLQSGDVNNDGRADLLFLTRAAITNNYSVGVSLARADGTYAPPVQTLLGLSVLSLAIADFNGDGNADIANAFFETSTKSIIRVRLSQGDGTFAPPSDVGLFGTKSLVSADFNNDGKADIASIGDASTQLLMGTGLGSFTLGSSITYGAGTVSSAVAADLNNDGAIDLALASSQGAVGSVIAIRNSPSGTLQSATSYAAGLGVSSLAAADLDGDGYKELAVANYHMGGPPQFVVTVGTFMVLKNNQNGAFIVGEPISSARQNVSDSVYPKIVAADFDGDGRNDLAMNYATETNVHLNAGQGQLAPLVKYATGNANSSIVPLDFNADGSIDLVIANAHEVGTITFLKNKGSARFETPKGITKVESIARDVATADLNGDLFSDLIHVGETVTGTTIEVRLNRANGTFASPLIYEVGVRVNTVVTADLNADGHLDIIAGSGSTTGSVHVLMNNGNNTFALPVGYSVAKGAVDISVADFTGDGRPDLAIAIVTGQPVLLVNAGNGTFGAATPITGSAGTASLEAAEFNGDGLMDLVIVSGGDAQSLLNNGDGTFTANGTTRAGNFATSLVTADFNNDGLKDIAVTNSIENTVSVLLRNGAGAFSARTIYSVQGGVEIALADLNNDGKPDLAATTASGVAGLINNGSGNFSVIYYGGASSAAHIAAGDFNGDGVTDLAVVDITAMLIIENLSPATRAPLFFDATMNVDLHAVSMQFNSRLNSASISTTDLFITNLTTNQTTTNAISATLSTDGKTVTFVLPTTLGDGNYRLSILAGTFTGANGLSTTVDVAASGSDLFILRGDLNHDRAVDFTDLLILAQNYGSTGRTYSQGNVNYSVGGEVDFDDLLLLAQRYGSGLAISVARPGVTRARRTLGVVS